MSEPSPLAAAIAGGCLRCGERTLFSGWVRFAHRCHACGLDYDSFGKALLLGQEYRNRAREGKIAS